MPHDPALPPAKPVTYRQITLSLPAHVQEILDRLGSNDPAQGGLPNAIGRLIGAVAVIGVALYDTVEPEHYQAFARGIARGLDKAKSIVTSANPRVVHDAILELEDERDAQRTGHGSVKPFTKEAE